MKHAPQGRGIDSCMILERKLGVAAPFRPKFGILGWREGAVTSGFGGSTTALLRGFAACGECEKALKQRGEGHTIERGSIVAPREEKKTREGWSKMWAFSINIEVQGAIAPLESKNRCNCALEENQNHFFLRCKVQPHHWKAKIDVVSPLRRSKILSSRGARCSHTLEEFFRNSHTCGGRKGKNSLEKGKM